LIQIDLQALPTEANTRIRVQQGVGVSASTCVGSTTVSAGTNFHPISYIESAIDGNLYFTKVNSSKLFVIPDPDQPMSQNLSATELSLANASFPDISTVNNAMVNVLPEPIDGYFYGRTQNFPGSDPKFDLQFPRERMAIVKYDIGKYNDTHDFTIAWGDGTSQDWSTPKLAHTYTINKPYFMDVKSYNIADGCRAWLRYLFFMPPCPDPTLTVNVTHYECATKFEVVTDLDDECLSSFSWNFGDGQTSTERNPIHAYAAAGTYMSSVTMTYNCWRCPGTKTVTRKVLYQGITTPIETQTVDVITDQKLEVITSSASSFTNAWPLQTLDTDLDQKGSYENGSMGIWRSDGAFVYEKPRSQSSTLNLRKDGTYTLDQFDWQTADLNIVPNWISANTVTAYSPYSYELENKDALGIYSSAIYDYGGNLATANGVNMRHHEMAFTGFEFMSGSATGNWFFKGVGVPAYLLFDINSGNKNMAVVEATMSQLDAISMVDIAIKKQYGPNSKKSQSFTKNEIICKIAHPTNPNWSIIVLKHAPYDGVWTGTLKYKYQTFPTNVPVITTVTAHTGKSSLVVSTPATYKQQLVRLIPGKTYWINAWVSVNNASVVTPVLGSGLGIDIVPRTATGAVISTLSFAPSGPVIEGWQQVRGSFVCPASTNYFELTLKNATGLATYFDDLRIQPEDGNMKCYVYDPNDFRLKAMLDEENFASLFFYDKEGNLYLTKKETKDGIKTISENVSWLKTGN
jgi:PKD repeat protein